MLDPRHAIDPQNVRLSLCYVDPLYVSPLECWTLCMLIPWNVGPSVRSIFGMFGVWTHGMLDPQYVKKPKKLKSVRIP